MSIINSKDKADIERYKKMYDNAKEIYKGNPERIEQAQKYAHEKAEKVRSKYGYSGGNDGSERIELKPKEKEKKIDIPKKTVYANVPQIFGTVYNPKIPVPSPTLQGLNITGDMLSNLFNGVTDSFKKAQEQNNDSLVEKVGEQIKNATEPIQKTVTNFSDSDKKFFMIGGMVIGGLVLFKKLLE